MKRDKMTIQKADPETRKRALCWVGVLTVTGAAAIHWGLPALKMYLFSLSPKDSLKMVCWILLLTFLSVSPLGVYLCLLGRKTLTTRQYPPKGIKVIRDTVVLTGSSACLRGRFLILGGVLLVVMSLVGAGYFPVMFYRVFGRNLPAVANPTRQYEG